MIDYQILALEHLLGTAVLAGLTLFFSMRFPEPGANREFRATLGFLTISALSVIPLFVVQPPGRLVWPPFILFLAGLLSFLVYVIQAARERLRRERERRRNK